MSPSPSTGEWSGDRCKYPHRDTECHGDLHVPGRERHHQQRRRLQFHADRSRLLHRVRRSDLIRGADEQSLHGEPRGHDNPELPALRDPKSAAGGQDLRGAGTTGSTTLSASTSIATGAGDLLVVTVKDRSGSLTNVVGGTRRRGSSCRKRTPASRRSAKKRPRPLKRTVPSSSSGQERGMSQAEAENLFGMIEKFAGYGFNKSQRPPTAPSSIKRLIEVHYPVEFMAALLSCGMEDTDRICEHVDDCRRMKIRVLAPDLNQSGSRIRSCGRSAARSAWRPSKAWASRPWRRSVRRTRSQWPLSRLFDLCERVDPRQLTKGNLDILIKACALDALGPERAQHLALAERAIQNAASKLRDKQAGQKNLFGGEKKGRRSREIGGPARRAALD